MLYPYQTEGISKLTDIITSREERAAMLCDPPGAGKTPQAIGVLNSLDASTILVVTPASLKATWAREIERWSSKKIRTVVLNTSKDPLPPASEKNVAIIVSYNLAVRMSHELCSRTYDMLICDEVHLCKSPQSQTARVVLVLIWAKCKYRLMLTGTPMPNGRAYEAFTTFSRCCYSTFGSWKGFKDRYLIEEMVRNKPAYPRSKNLEELRELSKAFMVRRPRELVLQSLPGIVRQNVYIQLPQYDVFKAQDGLDIDAILDAVDAGLPVDGEHITTARRKLSMLKAPFIVEAIKDALEDVKQLVVFVHHRELYAYIQNSFSDIVGINGLTPPEERQYFVDTFQRGEARIFLASLKAANTGLTLTAASTLIMAEYDWVPSTNEQAEGRIYRVTQKDICRVQYLVAADSLDEKVLKVVQRKQKNIMRALT